ncbi:FUSC family protein [Caballeronia sp. Lep1P3]|uniref:FUSC family protein n=1 Tax=Caballeronia sp. Lep1P3 TaxID=2878150 RepID=UPI001FD1ADB8|nr:FUSC family protein [Caballeronia sp. Lep1P3]
MSFTDRPRASVYCAKELVGGWRDWLATDGTLSLHLLKTLFAAFIAMGLAMRFELTQPRIAMTTTFVLMQPFSGMVLSKSVYRFAGTTLGMLAALVLGAVFVQQPELYVLGLTIWVAACAALAVRYRQFRWYGCVLAGYTAALIGVPVASAPDQLLLATLTRGAEVMLGIVCSSAVSALVFPRHASASLATTLAQREARFNAFAAEVLRGGLRRRMREHRYTDLVEEIVGFEATRRFAAYENPALRRQRVLLARLNNAFMDACARLHALDQSIKRLRASAEHPAFASSLSDLAQLLASPRLNAQALARFEASLRKRLDDASHIDTVTSAELLERLTSDIARMMNLRDAIGSGQSDAPVPTRYAATTDRFVSAATFARTACVIGAVAWFWISTAWPSGGLAVIGAILACALSSASARPARYVAHMAVGAAGAVLVGYLYLCRVYPAIDGFPLLCAVLAPPLAAGAFLAMRPATAGYGTGFCVFFCLLAAPDNVIAYDPAMLFNNGIAIVVSMSVTAIACAIILPPHMPWLVGKTLAALRAQAALACEGRLPNLSERFHSGTHDLMSQLSGLLTRRSREHRRALQWMLVTLEIGQAMIDLRILNAALRLDSVPASVRNAWSSALARMLHDIPMLFRVPDSAALRRAITAAVASLFAVEALLACETLSDTQRHDVQRMRAWLHFIRSALADPDAPFDKHR